MEQGKRDMRPGWVRAQEEGRELTWQQRLAERTSGVVRLPNLMTATGVGLTLLAARYASDGKPVAAAGVAAASFAMDMEGSVARHFGVEDPVHGAKIDQAADAAKAAIVATTLIRHDIMPAEAAAMTYGPKAVGAIAGVAAKVTSGTELPSSKAGKVAEVCRDVMPVAFMLAAAGKKFDKPGLEKTGRAIGWVAAGAALAAGTVAAIGYIREARKSADLSAHQGEILDHAEN